MPAIHRPRETEQLLYERFRGLPFTADQAVAAGVSPERLRASSARGLLRRLRLGVYVTTTALADADPHDIVAMRARAVGLVVPGVVASHGTARLLHRLPEPVPGAPPDPWTIPLEFLRPGRHGRAVAGVRLRDDRLDPAWRSVVAGVAVTDLARTAVDVARGGDVTGGLVVADAALRRLVTGEVARWDDVRDACCDPPAVEAARRQLEVVLAAQAGWPGSRIVRVVVRHASAGAESPLESWSRGTLLVAGLPECEAGVPVVGDDGRTYWVDMLWRRFGLVGEADGAAKYDRPRALYQEKQRQEAIERRGLGVVRWTGEEAYRAPQVVIERVARALRRRGWAGSSTPVTW